MPAWKSIAPRTRPELLPVLAGRLPEREVTGMLLARVGVAAHPGEQLVSRVPRQPAVGGKSRYVVINRGADLVCVALNDQLLDQLDHLRDVLRGAGILDRRSDVHLADVGHERVGVVGGDLVGRLVLQTGGDEHLVLASVERVIGEVADICDVHDLMGWKAEVGQAAAKEVRQHERPQVADVHVAVHGWTAGVDPHHAVVDRPELLPRASEGVVQPDRGPTHSNLSSQLHEGDPPQRQGSDRGRH